MKFDRFCNSFLNEDSTIDDAADLREDKEKQAAHPPVQASDTEVGASLPPDSHLPTGEESTQMSPEEEDEAKIQEIMQNNPKFSREKAEAMRDQGVFKDRVENLKTKYPGLSDEEAEEIVNDMILKITNELEAELKAADTVEAKNPETATPTDVPEMPTDDEAVDDDSYKDIEGAYDEYKNSNQEQY